MAGRACHRFRGSESQVCMEGVQATNKMRITTEAHDTVALDRIERVESSKCRPGCVLHRSVILYHPQHIFWVCEVCMRQESLPKL